MRNNKVVLFAFICLCLLVMFSTLYGQEKSKSMPISKKAEAQQNEVLRLEEVGRQRVVAGNNSWDDLISEGAYMIGPDGSVLRYELGKGFPPFPVKSFTLSEMIARSYGEIVVVTGLASLEAESPGRPPLSIQMRFMNVWKKFKDGWKMVVTERTSVKKPNNVQK